MATPFDLDRIFPGASGEFTVSMSDQHSDLFPRNQTAVRIEQRLPTMKVAAMVPVSAELLADALASRNLVEAAMDRIFRPWLFPDRNPMPTIVAVPSLERLASAARRRRSRVTTAWDTLRHGAPDDDADDIDDTW